MRVKGISSKLIVAIVILIVIVASVSAYFIYTSQRAQLGAPQLERTLIIAIPEEPEGLDIQQVTWANEVHGLIYQPLVILGPNMSIVPDLAVSWEVSEDGTVIIFHLSKDAKFSNGDPLTAEVIKKSIERYKTISPYAEDFADVERIEVLDEYTVKLILKRPAPYLWAVLVTVYGAPVNANVAEKVGDAEFNRNPVGSGPYKLVEWVRGSHVVLERNEYYKTNIPFVKNKGPNPYIDKVIIRFIPEDLTRIAELEAGRVHIVRGVPLTEVKRLKENPNIQLYETLSPGIHYIMVNVLKEPLNDVRVRKAIMLAINRDEIATVLEGNVVPWYSFLSPTNLCFNKTVEELAEKLYAYNLEKARELLKEAGWVDTDGDGIVDKNGVPLKLTLLSAVDDPALKKAAPLIQAHLAKVGIAIEIKEYTYDYVRSLTREWNFELALRRFSWADPDILIYLVHSEYGNYTYSNPEVDRLLELGRGVVDMTERTKVYSKVQEILLEDLPLIPLFVLKEYTAVNKNVKGLIVLPPYGDLIIHDAWIEKG
ncbi:MAG: ABC transporter substrate-binding protein [Desulfurococcaceae archaeon]|jgi:peptide/nickel transport system substrate-binding protein|nr:ABC transporter substrate-binding protein [Desulfurococcaceae archaeon]